MLKSWKLKCHLCWKVEKLKLELLKAGLASLGLALDVQETLHSRDRLSTFELTTNKNGFHRFVFYNALQCCFDFPKVHPARQEVSNHFAQRWEIFEINFLLLVLLVHTVHCTVTLQAQGLQDFPLQLLKKSPGRQIWAAGLNNLRTDED